MSKFEKLKQDKKLMSGIYVLTLITALMILVLIVKGPEESGGTLVTDEGGRVSLIKRGSRSRTEQYSLVVEIEEDGKLIEKEVLLTLRAVDSGKGETPTASSSEERAASIDAGLDTVINEIEYSNKKSVKLPDSLPDGTAITWKAGESKGYGKTVYIIPLMYFALVAAMIASRLNGDNKIADEKRKSILRALPRFCNQLFLMMNAGLILSDAFDVITDSYSAYGNDSPDSFERELVELKEEGDDHRMSAAFLISEYAQKHDVKEMIRIAAILKENERRGSDVIESLERESRYLWDERKIKARESGKMIDAKMSYPLGLLLILLIVITMAPAILEM